MTPDRALSVVIPTKDRAQALGRTLDTLKAQEGDEIEVIVVDNGSSDDSKEIVRERAHGAAIPIKLLDHPQGGPAAARNAGAEMARGGILLFLGDDTEPADLSLSQAHIDLHTASPETAYAVLGRITWTHRAPITPFMSWLENGGPQFNYRDLVPGPVDASSYFYSSHVSVKRAMFESVGGFDPRFPSAAVEDTDLGTRLADTGLILDYRPELLVLHDHPTTLQQSLSRQIRVGRSAALYNQLRPNRPHPYIGAPTGPAWSALRALQPIIDLAARLPAPRPAQKWLWRAMHHARYAQGYREGPSTEL